MTLRTLFQTFKTILPLTKISQIRSISFSPLLNGDDLTAKRKGATAIAIAEGVEGEKFYQFKGAKVMETVMPTIETLSQEFDGTPYSELPIISIKCSKTNTRIFIYDMLWKLKLCTSSKLEGFKNCKKKSTVAGQATGVAAGLKALRRGFKTVRVVVRGLGPGRLTAVKGLTLAGMNVVSISDFTMLPEKGPRSRKQRKV